MANDNQGYREMFDAMIHEVIQSAVRIIAADPALLVPATRVLHHQKKAAAPSTRTRRGWRNW